jgi:hypothetical protein
MSQPRVNSMCAARHRLKPPTPVLFLRLTCGQQGNLVAAGCARVLLDHADLPAGQQAGVQHIGSESKRHPESSWTWMHLWR